MTPLEKRQGEMRLKYAERKKALQLKRRRKTMARKQHIEKKPKLFLLRAMPGDIPAGKLDRMEELAYRISKRKWRLCL